MEFAEYARQNSGVERIPLFRMSKDALGNNQFKRLDMYRTAICDEASYAKKQMNSVILLIRMGLSGKGDIHYGK